MTTFTSVGEVFTRQDLPQIHLSLVNGEARWRGRLWITRGCDCDYNIQSTHRSCCSQRQGMAVAACPLSPFSILSLMPSYTHNPHIRHSYQSEDATSSHRPCISHNCAVQAIWRFEIAWFFESSFLSCRRKSRRFIHQHHPQSQ